MGRSRSHVRRVKRRGFEASRIKFHARTCSRINFHGLGTFFTPMVRKARPSSPKYVPRNFRQQRPSRGSLPLNHLGYNWRSRLVQNPGLFTAFVSRFFWLTWLERELWSQRPQIPADFGWLKKAAPGFWYGHSQVRILPPQPAFRSFPERRMLMDVPPSELQSIRNPGFAAPLRTASAVSPIRGGPADR